MKFDFDEWAQLFQNNPEEAERRRIEMIEAAIAEAPPEQQENLRQLQEHIDMLRTCYKDSPMAVCVALSQAMFMDDVGGGIVIYPEESSELAKRRAGAGGLLVRLKALSEIVKQYFCIDGKDSHPA